MANWEITTESILLESNMHTQKRLMRIEGAAREQGEHIAHTNTHVLIDGPVSALL